MLLLGLLALAGIVGTVRLVVSDYRRVPTRATGASPRTRA